MSVVTIFTIKVLSRMTFYAHVRFSLTVVMLSSSGMLCVG